MGDAMGLVILKDLTAVFLSLGLVCDLGSHLTPLGLPGTTWIYRPNYFYFSPPPHACSP